MSEKIRFPPSENLSGDSLCQEEAVTFTNEKMGGLKAVSPSVTRKRQTAIQVPVRQDTVGIDENVLPLS